MLEVRAGAFRRAGAGLLAACALAGADQLEYTVYHFGDNSENSVFTSSFSLAKTLFARTMVQLDVELDQVTLPAQPDAVSGASRPQRLNNQEFKKNRGQVILGLEQGLGDNTKVAANYYFSQETDYRSQSAVASLTQELFQKNFTVSLRGQYTLDSVGEIQPSGALVNRLKETWQASGSISQLLSPTTIVRLGGDIMKHEGFLSDSYRQVDIPDSSDPSARLSVQESHPSQRYRQAGWGEMSRFFRDLDAALHLHYRYAWDDWNLTSHTVQIKASKYVTRDWILTPNTAITPRWPRISEPTPEISTPAITNCRPSTPIPSAWA